MTRPHQTIDETGWTHVSPRNTKRGPHRRRRLSLRSSSPPPPLPPHHDLHTRIARLRRKVRELDVLQYAVDALGSVGEGEEVDVLLLGLGRVNLEVGLWQLAVALEVMGADEDADGEAGEREKRQQKVQRRRGLRAYDPLWSDEEKKFMNSIPGAEVVDLLQTTTPGNQGGEDGKIANGSEGVIEEETTSSQAGETKIILLAPHLELDVLSVVFEKLGHRIVAAMCNDLKMSGLEKEIEKHGWREEVLKEVKEAAQGRAFNHMAVYTPGREQRGDTKEQ